MSQIVSDGMLGHVQIPGDLFVPHSLGYQPHDILLPARQQCHSPWLYNLQRPEARDQFKEHFDLIIANPDLSPVYGADTLWKSAERMGSGEDTPGPSTKSVDHKITIGRIQQHDW